MKHTFITSIDYFWNFVHGKSNRCILVFALISIFNFQFSIAQTLPLNETATASVLTCGPGNDFYTTFGHSAIRITDTAQGLDLVYNYGTFDFDTPHFYWKFMRGKLNYCLSRSTFDNFMVEYVCEGREVREQRLCFTPQEVSNLYLLLEQNYLPEYRYYKYDFFTDNCASRIRDMVRMALGHREISLMRESEPTSYRRLVTRNLMGNLEWWQLGIDLLFGLPTDHVCDANERMFLPEEMEAEFAEAWPKPESLHDGMISLNALNATLVDKAQILLPEKREPLSRSFPPVVFFALLFVLEAVLTWKGRWPRWADRVLFVLAGVVGLFLLFMWFGTDHYCTQWNLNILWASPLLLLIAIRLERSPRWALWLQEVCFAVAAVWVLWCGLSLTLVPIILMLALRVAMLLKQ